MKRELRRNVSVLMFVAYLGACPLQSEPLIAVTRQDGGISIIIPVRLQRPDETEAEWIESIRLEAWPPDGTGYRVIDRVDLPSDRYFRNAWRAHATGVPIRIPRLAAETIHRQKLKAQQASKQEKWIKKWNEAQALGDTPGADEARAKLRALQSVDTTDLTTPTSLNALKQCVPAVLREPDP